MFLLTIPLSLALIVILLSRKTQRFIFNKIEDRHWSAFISSAGLFLLVTIAYSLGRRMKDAVISMYIGPEIINIIKLAIILPLTITLVFLYQIFSRNATQDDKERLLNKMFIFFATILALYGTGELLGGKTFFDKISPSISIQGLTSNQALNNILKIIELLVNNIWNVVIYVAVEMYGLLILSISFWTFISAYMTMDLAKVFYPYIMLLGSLSGITSGAIGSSLSIIIGKIAITEAQYGCLYNGFSFLICAGLLYGGTFLYAHAAIELKKMAAQEAPKEKAEKRAVGILEGFKALRHPVIVSTGLIVFCYMVCVILLEIPFKKSVLSYYASTGNRAGYDQFMSSWQILTGILTILFSFLSQYTLSRSWLFTAILSPVLLGISGILFFLFFTKHPLVSFIPTSPFITPLVGCIQTALAKALKYASVDGIKETALLSIKDRHTRENGKFSIESFGNKLGKGFGSLVQSLLIIYLADSNTMFTTSLTTSAIYTKYVYIAAIALWIASTLRVNKYMKKYEKGASHHVPHSHKPPSHKPSETNTTTKNKKLNNDN